MSLAHHKDDDAIVIRLDGLFNFSVHASFRDAYRYTDGPNSRYIVDLATVQYIDSSALGMLLLLREHGNREGRNVVLRGAHGDVRRILELARFDQLFVLE